MRIRKPLVLAATMALFLTGCTSGDPSSNESPTSGNVSASATNAPTESSTPDAGASGGTNDVATPGTMPSGFPEDLFPVMDGATLMNASMDPATGIEGAVTVAMVLTSTATPPDTLAYYDKAITDQGFTVTTQNNGANTFSRDYVRADGTEIVNLSINWPSDVVTVTIGANLLESSVG